MRFPRVLLSVGWLASFLWAATAAVADEPPAEVASLTPAQRLALEQIDQLIAAGATDEVVPLIVRTIDESGGRMVPVPPGAEFEPGFVRFVPLRMYLQDRLLRWGVSHPAVLEQYRQRTDAAAERRLEAARRSGNLEQAVRTAEAIFATSYGDDALLLLADLAVQRGWTWTAIGALRRIDGRWQIGDAGAPAAEVAAVGWEMWLPRVAEEALAPVASALRQRFSEPGGWPLGCYDGSDLPQAEVGLRLVYAYLLAGERQTAGRLGAILTRWHPDESVPFAGTPMPLAGAVEQLLVEAEDWPEVVPPADEWPTVGGDATRVFRSGPLEDLPLLPTWTRPLAVVSTAAEVRERLPVEPPVGELGEAPAGSLPIIHRDLVLVPTADSIAAYELFSGEPWPAGLDADLEASEQPALFRDSERADPVSEAGDLLLDGEPRFTLSAAEGRVAGRFGPVEAGWLAVARPRQPQSRIALIDLGSEGQLWSGYPLRAREVSTTAPIEFEGAPLIVGRRMYVGVAERDDATLTSSVLCVDVASGQPLFRTPLVGSSRPTAAEPRNRVAQCLVSYREGVVYYHGDSGSVAAIDAEDGSLRWVMRYPRAELDAGGYPRRRRGARVQLSGVSVLGPLGIVAAADSDRLFAVDASDGRLLWATAPGEADAVDQILGEVDGTILAGGDSLHWLDRHSGRTIAAWPAGVSHQRHGGLPQPRRSGRALLAGDQVYWPTRDAIWVFDGRLSNPTSRPHRIDAVPRVRPLRRIDLRAAGLRGGHLAAAKGYLIMASADTLAAFAGRLAYTETP